MNSKFKSGSAFKTLRKKAEQLIENKKITLPDVDELDLMRLAHEVEVQQVELELQNEELRQANREIETSRNEYFELFQTAPFAFVTVDDRGLIEQVNDAAAQLLAGRDDFLIGRRFESLVFEKDRQTYFSFHQQFAVYTAAKSCELRLKVKDDKIIQVLLEAAVKKDGFGSFAHWRYAIVDITPIKKIEDELRKSQDELEKRVAQRTAELDQRNKQLARLTSELTLAEQRDRRRMAELLHDHLQQLLAGARLNLDYVSRENAPAQHKAFQDAHDLVIKSLETSRSLSTELSPPVLYMYGLTEALKWLSRWMKTTHKLQVDLQADPQADPAQEEIKMLLFQSVRELLFNVVKHSGTNAAYLEMKRQDNRTIIKVSDKGAGFDIQGLWENNPNGKGYGLFNIRERLLLLGGAFEIASALSTGTTVTLTAPMQTTAFKMPESKSQDFQHKLKTGPPEESEQNRQSGKIRVLLVDDHAVMRKGLSLILSRHNDIEIAGEAANGQEAIEMAAKINPDVILMDISMPVMDGVAATRMISEQDSTIRVIGLSMHIAEDQAAAIKDAGAVAYLCKSGSPEAILSAIRGNDVSR